MVLRPLTEADSKIRSSAYITHVSLEQPGSYNNKLNAAQPSSKSTLIISEEAKVVKPIIAPQTSSWAALAADCTESDFTQVVNKRKPAARPVRIVGKRPMLTDSKVRSAPRRLTAFVGRLHIDTSEEELAGFLSAAGVIDPICKRLAAKGKTFKTAAFRVSCDACCRDTFYDESMWPAGCELRDWVFYDKPKMDNKETIGELGRTKSDY